MATAADEEKPLCEAGAMTATHNVCTTIKGNHQSRKHDRHDVLMAPTHQNQVRAKCQERQKVDRPLDQHLD